METPGASERARWARRLGDGDVQAGSWPSSPSSTRSIGVAAGHRRAHRLGPGGGLERPAWAPSRRVGAAPGRVWGVDVCLLSELDPGMARTENVDVSAAIAADLGAGHAFGVEFVELGLGDASEQREAAGRHNESGLHGNAIVTRAPLGDPSVVRLPETAGAGLVRGRLPQPRVGGRMAVVATVTIDGVAVEVASTHLENRSDPAHRAEQMEALLRGARRAVRRRSGRRRRRPQHARRQLRRAVRSPSGARVAPGRPRSLLVARALRTALRRGAGARFRVDRRERRRADHRARRASGSPITCRSSWTGSSYAAWWRAAPPWCRPVACRTTTSSRSACDCHDGGHPAGAPERRCRHLVRRRRRLRRRLARRARRARHRAAAPGPGALRPLSSSWWPTMRARWWVICRPHPAASTAAPRPSPGSRPCAWRLHTSSVARALR